MTKDKLKEYLKNQITQLLKEDDEGEDIDVQGVNPPKQPNQPQQPPQPTPKQPTTPTKKTTGAKQNKPNTLPVITRAEAARFIKQETKGRIFTATFIKKDGSNRIMNARLGVKKYLKGGKLPYNPEDFNYLPVFDAQIGQYRILNLNTLTSLTFGGKTYLIKEAL